MYHLRFSGDHYQMGAKRGAIFNKCGITFPLRLDAFQLQHGRQSEKLLHTCFPEVCEEIRGVTDTIGADYLTFASWMLCMGCCMYNLEENIPVELRGCTAFAFAKDGRVIYGRNNDLPPFLKEGSKSEIYAPDGGNLFNLTTSSFINGEEGLNEHGLAVAMTFVMTELSSIRPGLNSCFVVRYLLEKASNTEEAMKQLMALPISSNCNILLADRTGKMLVVECTPVEKRIREPENGILCTVNSFISDEMRPFDFASGDDYRSCERYETVMNTLPKLEGDIIAGTQGLLQGKTGFMCQYAEPDFETVWSSIFDLDTLRIYRAEGDPRRKKFITDDRLPTILQRRKRR